MKDKTKLINLRKIKDKLELEADGIGFSSDDQGEALISFHTFTGCDTVSAFVGKGRLKALKVMIAHCKYVAAFKVLGTSWIIEGDLLETLQEFVCLQKGGSGTSVNELLVKTWKNIV